MDSKAFPGACCSENTWGKSERAAELGADTVVIICFADEQSWAQEVEKGTRGHSQ